MKNTCRYYLTLFILSCLYFILPIQVTAEENNTASTCPPCTSEIIYSVNSAWSQCFRDKAWAAGDRDGGEIEAMRKYGSQCPRDFHCVGTVTTNTGLFGSPVDTTGDGCTH